MKSVRVKNFLEGSSGEVNPGRGSFVGNIHGHLDLKSKISTILSNFDKEVNLEMPRDTLCDGDVGASACDLKEESTLVCFQCKKRLCDVHAKAIHSHVYYQNHHTVPRELFNEVRRVFLKLDDTDEKKDARAPCIILLLHVGESSPMQ
jgi:hypothetical protein